jgi:hypothetical protein
LGRLYLAQPVAIVDGNSGRTAGNANAAGNKPAAGGSDCRRIGHVLAMLAKVDTAPLEIDPRFLRAIQG